MEVVRVVLDDGTGVAFDTMLHDPKCLKDDGCPVFITKDNCTMGGSPGVLIAFGVQLPDGKMAIAQTVVTRKLMAMVESALRGKYGEVK